MNSRGELRCDRHRTSEKLLAAHSSATHAPDPLSCSLGSQLPPLGHTSFAILRHRCSGSRMKLNFLHPPTSMQPACNGRGGHYTRQCNGRDHHLLAEHRKSSHNMDNATKNFTIIHAIAMGQPQFLLHYSIPSTQTTHSHQYVLAPNQPGTVVNCPRPHFLPHGDA